MYTPFRFYFSQDPNSGVVFSYLRRKAVGGYLYSLSLLGLFHFVVNDPARLRFPRKQDGVGMHVQSLR